MDWKNFFTKGTSRALLVLLDHWLFSLNTFHNRFLLLEYLQSFWLAGFTAAEMAVQVAR